MMGATVVEKLVASVTHVIFKDGSRITYQKAKKSGQHIVSAGWLEESKKEGRKMPESEFPSVSAEKYDTPGLFPKIKKMKSMQPKTLDEDFEAASKAHDRKLKMSEKKLLKEFQTLSGTPIKLDMTGSSKLSPKSPSESDFDTPLARRLANKYLSPVLSRNILTSASSPAILACPAAQEEEVEDHDDTAEDPVPPVDAGGVHTPLKLRDGLHNHTPDKLSEKDVETSNLVMKIISPG